MLKNPAFESLTRLLGRLIPNAGSWSSNLQGSSTIDEALTTLDAKKYGYTNSGVISWGTGTDYYSIVDNTFTLLRDVNCAVHGIERVCEAGNTLDLTDATDQITYLIYTQANHLLHNCDIMIKRFDSPEIVWGDICPLLEIYHSPAGKWIVVREDHPAGISYEVNRALHFGIGTNVSPSGDIIERVATGTGGNANDRRIKISAGYLNDHGLLENHGAINPISFRYAWRTNPASPSTSPWEFGDVTSEALNYYNNSGTLAQATFGVSTVYISKSDLNSSSPTFFVVPATANYNNLTQANNAINNTLSGEVNGTDGFIAQVSGTTIGDLELTRLGFLITQGTNPNGYINGIRIAKRSVI